MCVLRKNSATFNSLRAHKRRDSVKQHVAPLIWVWEVKGKFERAQQLHVKKNAKEGAKTPAQLKAYLSGVVPSCVLVSIWSRHVRGSHRLNSANEEVTTEREQQEWIDFTHNDLVTCSLAHCPHKHTSFLLPCLSASPRQPQCKNTVTSQTCQINHTCCNVIIYIIILIRKLVTRGANHRRRGVGAGHYGGFIGGC